MDSEIVTSLLRSEPWSSLDWQIGRDWQIEDRDKKGDNPY